MSLQKTFLYKNGLFKPRKIHIASKQSINRATNKLRLRFKEFELFRGLYVNAEKAAGYQVLDPSRPWMTDKTEAFTL